MDELISRMAAPGGSRTSPPRRGALLGGSGLGTAALALLLVPGLALGGGAAAQTVLPPAPAPGGPVSGPPDGAIPPGPPIRLPTPTPAPGPAPTPPPAPTPTPAPPASPTPSPAPAPAAPREPRPGPQREAPPRPAADQPAPADAPPPAEAPPVPDSGAFPGSGPTLPPAPAQEGGLPSWWPYALAAALAALAGGWWALRRRRAPEAAVEEAPPIVKPAAPPAPVPVPVPVAPQPVVKQQKTKRAPREHPHVYLQLDIEPITASTTLVNLRLRYALLLRNPTKKDIALTGHAETILAGSGAQEDVIRQWFAVAPLAADVSGTVPAGGELRIERELAVPLTQLSAMRVRDRTVMIPVLLLALSFRHATGLGRMARAFVIGKPGAADAKLAPLQLDQGMGGFGALAARDTGIAQND